MSNAILQAMARMLCRDYGARAYQEFVLRNPGGRVPLIERAIMAAMGLPQ